MVLRVIALTTGAAAVLASATACSSAAHHDPPASSPAATHSTSARGHAGSGGPAPTWLMTRQVVSEVTGDTAVRNALGAGPLDELLKPGQRPVTDVSARPIVDFASAAALERAVAGRQLPTGTDGVLYDPEAWPFTPVAEQRAPVAAAARAAAVAHAHGLRFIVAPALDLTTVLGTGAHGSREREFLHLGLVGRLARSADVIELQAQSLERDTAGYRRFVRRAAAQAHVTGHRVQLLAGLSTNPPGAPVTVARLRRDIDVTRATVAGYWLNIPGRGPRCPTCNPSRPDIAAQLTVRP